MKKKVLFILPNLAAGGAERVISFVAENIDCKKFESKLLIAGYEEDAAYPIDNLNVKFLEKKRVLTAIPGIFFFLLKNKPDIVLSSVGHLNTVMGLMAIFFYKTKFIIREASVISSLNEFDAKPHSNNLHSYLSHLSYKKVDKIICQSQDMAKDFTEIYKNSKLKITIINNPITQFYPLKKNIKTSKSTMNFITVGRLSKEKGHLRIIKILSKLDFQFHYTIIGSGPLKEKIFNAINEYNLNDKITYIPFTKEVLKYLSLNDLFLQGSYVEGFPNTVLESCYVGTPVIAFNVPGGTKEIIIHEENGYLVETDDAYLHYLNNRLELNPKKIRESVESRFNKERIISQYEALF
tara:strand:+ start:10751 stop:11803 length:1053 start_codon:yes stop_codon:yes gene_type:complete